MRGDIFKQNSETKRNYSMFDLSHSHKTTLSMGLLYPTLVMECLPGDKFSISVESLTRMMPLVSPALTKFIIRHHLFFVPNRLVWDGWEDFITGNQVLVPPYIDHLSDCVKNSLGHYMGIPIVDDDTVRASAIPFAAYALIWDDYYRPQQLIAEQFTPLTAGDNTPYGTAPNGFAAYNPFIISWQHDYFTSCLPYPQEGSSPVVIPFSHSGNDPLIEYQTGAPVLVRDSSTGGLVFSQDIYSKSSPTGSLYGATNGLDLILDPNGSLFVDTTDAATIADLRRAIVLQEFLERDIRGGLRYVENMYSHFGVKPKDMRLQRPEYIGGVKSNMIISEVLSSAETVEYNSNDVLNPVGAMAGHGIGVAGSNKLRYFCEEHGYLFCLTSIIPEADYYQGLHKHWFRTDRLDYYWHEFAQIGEQEVLVKELYCEDTAANIEATFGYLPRYSEYKYMNNRISGELTDTLDYWHLARQFSGLPALTANFVYCIPDNRIFADTAGEQIVAHINFNIDAFRQIPKFSNPKL